MSRRLVDGRGLGGCKRESLARPDGSGLARQPGCHGSRQSQIELGSDVLQWFPLTGFPGWSRPRECRRARCCGGCCPRPGCRSGRPRRWKDRPWRKTTMPPETRESPLGLFPRTWLCLTSTPSAPARAIPMPERPGSPSSGSPSQAWVLRRTRLFFKRYCPAGSGAPVSRTERRPDSCRGHCSGGRRRARSRAGRCRSRCGPPGSR